MHGTRFLLFLIAAAAALPQTHEWPQPRVMIEHMGAFPIITIIGGRAGQKPEAIGSTGHKDTDACRKKTWWATDHFVTGGVF